MALELPKMQHLAKLAHQMQIRADFLGKHPRQFEQKDDTIRQSTIFLECVKKLQRLEKERFQKTEEEDETRIIKF